MGANIIAFIPDLLGAIFLLIIGGIIGWLLGEAVTSFLREVGLGRFVRGTPLDTGDGERLSGALGSLVKYFVYTVRGRVPRVG